MTDCPGSCNAWWRNLTHAQQDTSETGPRQGEPVWCHPCAARIRRTPGDLNTLSGMLEYATDGYGEAPDQPAHHGHAHPPSPSPNFDLNDEIERMMMAWEREYCRVKNWASPPRHGRYAAVSYEVAAFLMQHMDGILESPFAYEFGDEALAAGRTLVAKAKAGSGYKRSLVPCPRCGLKLLGSTDSGSVFWCASCGRPVPKDEHDDLARTAARDLERAS